MEKSFDGLKNDLDMRRLYVHSDAVANGKAFVAFLALIIRSQMQNLLQNYLDSHKFTFRKVLMELEKGKLICSSDHPNHCRLLNPPTKTQREILKCLSISQDTWGEL